MQTTVASVSGKEKPILTNKNNLIMKETKKYQVPELRVIDLKARLMQEVVPIGASNKDPDSFQAEFEEEDENSGSVEL